MNQARIPSRRLGRTDLVVTRLGYGAMEIRGERTGTRPVSDERADSILTTVLDSGIDFIDTASCYGESERHIGRAISSRRSEYTLATKFGCWIVPAGDHDDTPHSFEHDHLLDNMDASLAALQTDHVDLLQAHNPTVEIAQRHDVVGTLREMKAAGKTRYIGISSRSPDLADYIDWGDFDVIQIPYSALERRHENLIARAHESGIGTIIRGGVQRGPQGNGLGTEDRWTMWRRAGLDELLDENESRSRFLTRFSLSHPGIDTVIVGTLSAEHLRENIDDVGLGALPDDVYAEAKRRLDDAGESPEEI